MIPFASYIRYLLFPLLIVFEPVQLEYFSYLVVEFVTTSTDGI